ncbi:hypothetical protein FSP39_009736 [Pinctada imbricata]|uniref:Uncharacterized protein n=1 Tax=Pinctada imbricata TaxID=66713 RepID=A0AA89C5V4_PINIB|nr:hypothetical protein FSP39_009736 [Pinctada imbricata]
MEKQSLVPRYGTCWKGAIKALVDGCKALTDDVQSRLALAYLNCFLEVQGRPTHECDETMSFKECVFFLDDADRGSLTTFFTHTQNICYFLESQMWHDETETTINRLAKNSESVADQLETASELQSKIIEKQGESLQNQHRILATANNLSDSISESSINLQSLSSDLKKTSEQQKLLVKLQTMVLGEISGFYSIVYYVLAMIVAYIVTSTARTSGARLWLFAIITVNIAIEWLLLSKNMAEWLSIFGQDARDNWDEMLYEHQWLCRKICAVVCLVVIGYTAYRYSDVNWINNKLLLEIRQQNSDLRHLLQGLRRFGIFFIRFVMLDLI